MSFPRHLVLMGTLLVLTGALFCATLLLIDPSGLSLGMRTSLLDGTPFNNYTLPAILLLCLVAMPHSVTAYYLVAKPTRSLVWLKGSSLLLLGFLGIELGLNQEFWHAPMHIPLFGLALLHYAAANYAPSLTQKAV